MHLLFSTHPAHGHLRPLVPVAQAARRRGHRVTICTAETLAADCRGYGLPHRTVGVDWLTGSVARLGTPAEVPAEVLNRFRTRFAQRLFAGRRVGETARELLDVAADDPPDLVVRDNSELGGALAAEALGVPHVSVEAISDLARVLRPETLSSALGLHRSALGLPPDPDGSAVHAALHVTFVPPEFDPDGPRPPNNRSYRQTSAERPSARLPAWICELPADRPLVLAGLGTLGWGDGDALRAVCAALDTLDCTAIVIGGKDRAEIRLPDRVRLVESIEQPLLLELCDLFLTHGGFNSVREALRVGVPLVVVPVFGDQYHNAERCAELGVARTVPSTAAGAEQVAAIREACATVLTDPGYRRRAEAMRRRILAQPPMDALVDDLERLVAGVLSPA